MQFFEMNQQTRRIMTSPQIWIYFATAAGASVVTVILYWLLAGFPKIHKAKGGNAEHAGDKAITPIAQRACTDIEKNPKILGS